MTTARPQVEVGSPEGEVAANTTRERWVCSPSAKVDGERRTAIVTLCKADEEDWARELGAVHLPYGEPHARPVPVRRSSVATSARAAGRRRRGGVAPRARSAAGPRRAAGPARPVEERAAARQSG